MPPKHARSGPNNRRYYDWNGERYWSVTTLTKGGLPESYGLSKWKRTIVAKGAVEATQSGILPSMVEQSPDAAVEYLAQLPFSRTAKAADLGTEVHAQIEALVLGAPAPDPSPEAEPFIAQWREFLAFYEPEFLLAEASVYNRERWYAGTLDAVVRIDGRDHVLDVKTGGVWPEVALQLAAYRNAQFIGLPNGQEEPMLPTEETGLVLDLKADGYRLVEVDTGHDVYMTFLYCRETFRWDVETSKRVFLGTYRRASADPITQAQLAQRAERAKRPADPEERPTADTPPTDPSLFDTGEEG